MKKIAAAGIIFLTLGTIVNAQTTQGTLSVGGQLQFAADKQTDSDGDTKTNSFELSPSVGYFVADNLMVGASIYVGTGKTTFGPNNETKVTSFGGGPFARYYMFTKNEAFAFYGEAGVGFNGTKQVNGNNSRKGSSIGAYVAPGFAWFPTQHWSIDLQLSLLNFRSNTPDKDNKDNKTTSFSFGVDSWSPSLGVRYFF